MIEIRPLTPRRWEPSEPLVAYNNADRRIVVAAEMRRGDGSYYDRYGYRGSRDIVCIDCKEAGKDVPVILVEAEKKCIHFRHKAGEAPDGLRRHGETAEHLHGKKLVIGWAGNQRHINPWSVEEEVWVPGVRLRSDVKAEMVGGGQLAFEVQRKPLDQSEWDRRHGGYQRSGIQDVWLWSPEVPDPVLDLPLTSVVLDLANELLGVFVASYSGEYCHPTAGSYLISPTHYASAPLEEWRISESGTLAPPPELVPFIGDKPTPARIAQIRARQEAAARRQRQPGDAGWVPEDREEQRRQEALARIFRRKR